MYVELVLAILFLSGFIGIVSLIKVYSLEEEMRHLLRRFDWDQEARELESKKFDSCKRWSLCFRISVGLLAFSLIVLLS
jgi:hypothetical protein